MRREKEQREGEGVMILAQMKNSWKKKTMGAMGRKRKDSGTLGCKVRGEK